MCCAVLCCAETSLSIQSRTVQVQLAALTLSLISFTVFDSLNVLSCRLAGLQLLIPQLPNAMLVILGQILKAAGGMRVSGRWWAPAAQGGLLAAMLEVTGGRDLGTLGS